jgi:amino acid adenylation domain-containing protein
VRTVIHSEIEAVAARRPNATAIRAPEGEVGYGRLDEAANGIAGRLRDAHGIGTGSVVALFLPVGIAYVAALLGVAKAGGVFLPLDPATPLLRLRPQIARTRPAVAIVEAAHEAVWCAAAPKIPALRFDQLPVNTADPLPLAVSGEEASYIVFTSGSAGEPKAILGSQKGLSHFIHWEVREFSLGPDDRLSLLAPPTFDVSLRDILAALLAGGIVCIPPVETRRNIGLLLDWLQAEHITLVHCVPSLFRVLTREIAERPQPSSLLPELRHVLLAGEPLYIADVERWRALIGRRVSLVNLYGPSETTLAKAFYRIDGELPDEPGRMIPVGRPLPNTALLVIRDGELCDPGEIGEVFIKTPFMSKGYVGPAEQADEAFVQNPLVRDKPDRIYRTGDFGRYRPDRTVELLGRRDDQVKVNGVRIELAEVQNALLAHPAIREAVVTAHQGSDHQVSLAAYFIADAPLDDAILRAHLTDRLESAMHPAFFVQMDSFPLNLHGKVNRRALPRPVDLLYRDRPCIPAADEIETAIAAIWAELLDLPRIGVTHAFVELGGDSLTAIRMLGRIARDLGAEVMLEELFPRGTVRDVAALVRTRRLEPEPDPETIAPPTEEEWRWLRE